ncbi:hypothetical protein B0J13DRAFT_580914 [Dactylonectria estremocensis]|uniref:Phosphatidate cytidylyltransferase n=1 Tax=Dactylonectria estremocensis TaxID=1079267 RepID=A0A9P9FB28_9HYPO|nr:hypothetical protein B0J13DRAFT_580914 [Dactylonectria estremocensis]
MPAEEQKPHLKNPLREWTRDTDEQEKKTSRRLEVSHDFLFDRISHQISAIPSDTAAATLSQRPACPKAAYYSTVLPCLSPLTASTSASTSTTTNTSQGSTNLLHQHHHCHHLQGLQGQPNHDPLANILPVVPRQKHSHDSSSLRHHSRSHADDESDDDNDNDFQDQEKPQFGHHRRDTNVRSSRRDKHLHSPATSFWPCGFDSLRRIVVGAIRCPALPPFSFTMSLRSNNVPSTPRVISPSPTPSEVDARDYSGPVTRSAARRRTPTPQPLEERSEEDEPESPDLRRARTRSRSPIGPRTVTRLTSRTSTAAKGSKVAKTIITEEPEVANGKVNGNTNGSTNGKTLVTNGHLAPPQPSTPLGWTWRDFSRSPSPLGLIPIHRHWRTFVHKHEVPRKFLHVSIGFFVVWLYVTGTQPSAVTPWLMAGLIPITTVDWLRHRYASFNRFYVKVLGALMRESEYSGWNGVIFYLLGAWIVLFGFPKDVGIISVLLLSWCDTAASTFGRLWGRYTPRLRRGKSLAGSTAAFLVGVATSYFFYGWLVPTIGPFPGDESFMFKGALSLPKTITEAVGLSEGQATITGSLALGVMSVLSGFIASASEVVDIFGWDDNLTIPVLSGIGIWGFLKIFS